MEQYAILRRSGWRDGAALGEAAARSTKVGDEEMPEDVRWIRSYVLDEGDGPGKSARDIVEASETIATMWLNLIGLDDRPG